MNTKLKISLFILSLMTIVSCGSKNPVSNFNGTTQQVTNGTSPLPIDSTEPQSHVVGQKAFCTSISGASFTGRSQLFRMQGAAYDNTQQVQLDNLPNDFSDSQSVLTFSKWRLDGTVDTAKFYIEDRFSQIPISGMLEAVSAADMTAFAARQYGANMGPRQFLARVNFVVISASSREYNGLRLGYFQNQALVEEVDFLIPIFAADLSEFSSNFPSLEHLHPDFQNNNSGGAFSSNCF